MYEKNGFAANARDIRDSKTIDPNWCNLLPKQERLTLIHNHRISSKHHPRASQTLAITIAIHNIARKIPSIHSLQYFLGNVEKIPIL